MWIITTWAQHRLAAAEFDRLWDSGEADQQPERMQRLLNAMENFEQAAPRPEDIVPSGDQWRRVCECLPLPSTKRKQHGTQACRLVALGQRP